MIYGSSPIAATTWDANMIHGCSADTYGFINSGVDNITEFIGSALDELDCPVAYNTRLTDIVYTKSNYTVNREIQRVKCRATDGYFLVQFRGMLSQPIHRNASSTEVKNILQNVPTIGQVVVDFAEDTVCGRGSFHYANVTFLSQVGKIPLLILDKSNLGGYRYGLTVERLNSVSSTPLECGGYGSCDKKTGQCNCWKYRSTSDGYGNAGNFGDCGHYLLQ